MWIPSSCGLVGAVRNWGVLQGRGSHCGQQGWWAWDPGASQAARRAVVGEGAEPGSHGASEGGGREGGSGQVAGADCSHPVSFMGFGGMDRWKEGQESVMLGGHRGLNHSSREAGGDMRSQGSFRGQLVTVRSQQ